MANNMRTAKKPARLLNYTIETKCKVLSHLNHIGGNISQCARDYDIPRRVIGKWKAQSQDIFDSTHKRRSFRVNNKMRDGFWPLMENELNEWLV